MILDRIRNRHVSGALLLATCAVAYFLTTSEKRLSRASVRSAKDNEAASLLYASALERPGAKASAAIPRRGLHAASERMLDGQLDIEPEDIGLLTAPPCDDVAIRSATLSRERRWSVAMLQGAHESSPLVRRTGDKVGDFTVSHIGFNWLPELPSVWLSKGTQLCQSMLLPLPQEATEDTANLSNTPLSEDISSKIKKVSETEFIVRRDVVDEVLARLSEGRPNLIVPEREGEEIVGLRVFGIRPGSLMGTLGLKNGDRLEAINDLDLSTQKKLFEAFASIQNANEVTVRLNRRGRPLSVVLHLR